MITYKCKCGKTTAISSMGVRSCEGCDECGTQLYPLLWSGIFEKRKNHSWEIHYDFNTGKPYKVCKRCFLSSKEAKAF